MKRSCQFLISMLISSFGFLLFFSVASGNALAQQPAPVPDAVAIARPTAEEAKLAERRLAEGADEVYVNGDSFIPGAQALEPLFKTLLFAAVEA